MALKELDRVVFTRAAPDAGVAEGDVGVVVHVYPDGAAYEVEVFTLTGETLAVATAKADAVRPVSRNDVVSARVSAR